MNDIYEQVISKQNEVIAAAPPASVGRHGIGSGSDPNAKMDELITLLMDNFSGIPTADDLSRIFFRREESDKHIDTFDINNLKSLPAEVVPVAVMRYLLNVKRICIDPRKCKSFDRFAEAYSDIILQA